MLQRSANFLVRLRTTQRTLPRIEHFAVNCVPERIASPEPQIRVGLGRASDKRLTACQFLANLLEGDGIHASRRGHRLGAEYDALYARRFQCRALCRL